MPERDTLAAIGVEPMPTLAALLAESEVVSLHVPGTPDTTSLIDARALALMPPGSFLVNTARGNVVDTDALISALLSGHLAGAGLDVYPREPEVDRRLLGMDQVTLLPHLGSATREGREAMGFRAMKNLEAFFDGKPAPDRVGGET